VPEKMAEKISKGSFLIVKSPPYYRDEYIYEVVSAGEKIVRASLHRSPKVKKSWNVDELSLLIEMGVIRLAEKSEVPS
jgi:hypothetical protein